MKTYITKAEIAAPTEWVWSILTNEMPEDPTPFGILKIEGTLAQGRRIKLWSEVSPKRAFALKVEAMDAPSSMVWRGGMPFGLFTGTRTFRLTSCGHTTLFEMTETFSGPLARTIVRSIPDLTPSFEKFAATLKAKAENHD